MHVVTFSVFALLLGTVCAGEKHEKEVHGKWQALSPWELYVLNDLLMEIALTKCPEMDRPSARSLKNFITEAVKKARTHETMNLSFLPVYTNLVKCASLLDEQSRNPGKMIKTFSEADIVNHQKFQGQSETVKGNERASASETEDQNQITAGDGNAHIEQSVPEFYTTEDFRAQESSKDDRNWFDRLENWFNENLRLKRDVPAEEEQDDSNKHTSLRHNELDDAEHNFQKMLLTLSGITMSSCPRDLTYTDQFSRQLIRELVKWIFVDKNTVITASKKYFENAALLNQAQKCLSTIVFAL